MGSGRVNVGGGTVTDDATATNIDILQGKTAYARGEKLTGTYVPLNTQDATATAADILKGKTAYAQDRKLTGTLDVSSTINGTKKDYYVYQSVTVKAGDFITFVTGVSGAGTGGTAQPYNLNNKFYLEGTRYGFGEAAFTDIKSNTSTLVQQLGGIIAQCALTENLVVVIFTNLCNNYTDYTIYERASTYLTSAVSIYINGTTLSMSQVLIIEGNNETVNTQIVFGCGWQNATITSASSYNKYEGSNSEAFYYKPPFGTGSSQAYYRGCWFGRTFHIDRVSNTQCIFLVCENEVGKGLADNTQSVNPTKMTFYFLTAGSGSITLNGTTQFVTNRSSTYRQIAPTKRGVLKVFDGSHLGIIMSGGMNVDTSSFHPGIDGCTSSAIMYMTYVFGKSVTVEQYVDIGVPYGVCFEIFDNQIAAFGNVRSTGATDETATYKFYCVNFDVSKSVRKQCEVTTPLGSTAGSSDIKYPFGIPAVNMYYQIRNPVDICKISNNYYIFTLMLRSVAQVVAVVNVSTQKANMTKVTNFSTLQNYTGFYETVHNYTNYILTPTQNATIISNGQDDAGIILTATGYIHFKNNNGVLTYGSHIVFDMTNVYATKYNGNRSTSSSHDKTFLNNGWSNTGSYEMEQYEKFGRKYAFKTIGKSSSFLVFFGMNFIQGGEKTAYLNKYWSEYFVIRVAKMAYTASGVGFFNLLNETQVRTATTYSNINGVAITGGTGGTATAHNQKVTVMSLSPPN